MKSSKVISIVLLVGMASQAHGMFGRLGSALTTRGLVAATAAAATTAGLGRSAYAEGEKPKVQDGLVLASKFQGYSWWKPWTWSNPEVESLQLITNGSRQELPFKYKTTKHKSRNNAWPEREFDEPYVPWVSSSYWSHKIPYLPLEKCIKKFGKDSPCWRVSAEQGRYETAARLMVATERVTRDFYPELGFVITSGFKTAKEKAGITGLDDKLLKKYYRTALYDRGDNVNQKIDADRSEEAAYIVLGKIQDTLRSSK